MKEIKPSSFRYDLNGLRAIAVLSVIIFHYSHLYLSGGFIGVDIFFVISGYLMTLILSSKKNLQFYDFYEFYLSRAKRIVPALLTICTVIIAIGFFLIDPANYQILGKHIVASLFFISNIVYYSESGYFDQSSLDKYFLHTWSLSVEWQFYIIYPFLILLVSNIKKYKLVVLIILTFTSFISSIILTKVNSDLSYYMFFTRAWEMLIGGITYYFFEIKNKKRIKIKNSVFYEIIALVFIIISLFKINSASGWPNIYCIIPVISTSIILFIKNEKTILNNFILQYLGGISYSLYLVHWPVIVLFKKMNITLEPYSYLFITLISGVLLHNLVERKRNFSFKWLLYYTFIIIVSLIICYNGLSLRTSGNDKYKISLSEFRNKYEGNLGIWSNDPIYFNSDAKNFEYILIGSSHARHYYSYLEKSDLKVVSLALDGCNSTKNYYTESGGEICKDRYKFAIDFINKNPNKTIIWATLWDWMGGPRNKDIIYKNNDDLLINEVSSFINDINGRYKRIYLIGDVPGTKSLTFECLARNTLPLNRILNLSNCNEFQKYKENHDDQLLNSISTGFKNTFFIKSSNALCDNKKCRVIYNGEPIYTDYGHLSRTGANIVGNYIESKIAK